MKMLKKAGALAIAGAMAMSLGTISAFADSAITLGTIEYTPATEVSSIATFKVPYTAAAGVSQVTLLAELGAAEGVFANAIAYSTTAYIDQEAADTYFEFKIDDSRLQLAEDQEKLFLNVKVGGTGVSTPATASLDITPVVEDESPVTKEMITGAIDAEISNAFDATGAKVVRLDVTDLVTANKLDLAKQAVKIGDDYAYYTVTASGKYKVLYIGTLDETTTVEVVDLVDVEDARRVYYGDVSGDTKTSVADISDVIANYLNQLSFEDKMKLAADVTGDGKISVADISDTIAKYLNQITEFTVESK